MEQRVIDKGYIGGGLGNTEETMSAERAVGCKVNDIYNSIRQLLEGQSCH